MTSRLSNPPVHLAAFGVVVAVGLGLRLLLAWKYYGNFDQQSYEIVQGIMRSGGNVYAETARYNYSPVWSWLLAGFDGLGSWLSWPSHAMIRTGLTLVDALTAFVLLRLGGAMAASIFLLSPVSILITGYHGQFDNLAVLLLLLTLLGRPLWTWVLAPIAVLVKQIVLPMTIYLQPGWPLRRRLLIAGISLGVFIASLLPALGGPGAGGVVRNVVTYGGLVGDYGVTSLHPALALPGAAFILRMVLIVAFLILAIRPPADKVRALLIAMLLFVVLTPGFGTQYFILPIALGTLTRGWGFWLYSLVAAVHILGSPVSVAWLPATHPNVVWLAAILWLAHELTSRVPKALVVGQPV